MSCFLYEKWLLVIADFQREGVTEAKSIGEGVFLPVHGGIVYRIHICVEQMLLFFCFEHFF